MPRGTKQLVPKTESLEMIKAIFSEVKLKPHEIKPEESTNEQKINLEKTKIEHMSRFKDWIKSKNKNST